MEWKQVKDNLPPTDEVILLANRIYDCDSRFKFKWEVVVVRHPHDRDKKYSKDYYYYYKYCEHPSEQEYDLSPYDFWMKVKLPEDPDQK